MYNARVIEVVFGTVGVAGGGAFDAGLSQLFAFSSARLFSQSVAFKVKITT